MVRIEGAVTSISWVPGEAVHGVARPALDLEVPQDDPPPDVVAHDDLERLRRADRFRFAHELRAWIQVDGDRITAHGASGGGVMGAVSPTGYGIASAAFAMPDILREPEVREGAARFVRTAGGCPGVPVPRTIDHPPFVRITAPLVWTTLALTIHSDGRVVHEMLEASTFPRHWIYDASGRMVSKAGLDGWHARPRNTPASTPWGEEGSSGLANAVSAALMKQLDASMHERPPDRHLVDGEILVSDEGHVLLLDGVLGVEVGRELVAELVAGAVVASRGAPAGARDPSFRARGPATVAFAASGLWCRSGVTSAPK